MNKVLVAIGILALVAAGAVFWWPDQKSGITPAEPPQDPGVPKVAPQPDTVTITTTNPILVAPMLENLPTADLSDYRAATGREVAICPMGEGDASLSWSPLDSGRVEILVASTLGGVQAKRHLTASWSETDNGAIAFKNLSSGGRSLAVEEVTARPVKGIWQANGSDDPAIVASVLDAARAIASLRGAKIPVEKMRPGSDLRIAGEQWRVWSGIKNMWLLVGPDVSGKLPADNYPASVDTWNDLRIRTDGSGEWQAVERLSATPSTVEQPGYSVRRILLYRTS